MYEFLTREPRPAEEAPAKPRWPLALRAGIALYLLAFVAFVVLRHPQPPVVASAHQGTPVARTEVSTELDPPPALPSLTSTSMAPAAEIPVTTAVPATPSANARLASVPGSPSRPIVAQRLEIPAIGVDAPIGTAGPPVNGQLAAPPDADSVVWYGFTAEPGASGNVLIAGHVDLGQRTAVFWNLRKLGVGDVVTIRTSSGDVTYVVERSYAVAGDTTDTQGIIGTRSGPPTLTLITCDGSFVSSRHAYDQRRIVVASLRT